MLADMAKNIAQDLSNAFERAKNDATRHAPGLSSPLDNTAIQKVIQSALQQCNIVTREEFDAQSAVLLRTREKLEALEAQVQALEAASSNPPADTPND